MSAAALPPLYAIVDPLDTGREPTALAKALVEGGATLLQLRLKAASTRTLLDAAAAIRELTRAHGVRFLVNDRPDVARAVAADGVHLGQDDLPVAAARRVLGPGPLIGVSTHDLDQACAAVADGADYIGVGPIYPTTTKADALAPRGLDLLGRVRRVVPLPIVAIGGITVATAPTVRVAGADSVAMIADLVRAPDVAARVRAVLAALAGTPSA